MSAAPQPPFDVALQKRIDALCAYAAKNGTAFLQSIIEKQSSAPEYSFLHGGPGADYYQYKLQAATAAAPSAQPAQGGTAPPTTATAAAAPAAPAVAPAAASAAPAPAPAAAAPTQQDAQDPALATLPVEVSSGWQQVLGLLTGSRDSIRNSQQWFMACAPYAAGMAAMMLQHVLHLADYQKQLHVVYLANDILFKGLSMRAAGSGPDQDGIAAAFKPRLGRLLRQTYVTGGQAAEVQQNLLRVVNFWAERGVFDHLAVEQMTMEMMGISAPAAGAAQAAGTAQAAAPGGTGATAAAPPAVQQHQQPQPAGAGAPMDLAAHAKAVAAAINAKQGMPTGGAPQQPAQSRWGQQPPDSAAAAAAAQQQQPAQSRWGQQPPDVAAAAAAAQQQQQQPMASRWGQGPPDVAASQAMAAQHQAQQAAQQAQWAQQPPHMAAAAVAAAAYQQQAQQAQQQAYPAGGAYPPPPDPSMYYSHAPGAAPPFGAPPGGHPGYAPPPPGAAPGYAAAPHYPGQHHAYPPPPPNGAQMGAAPPPHAAYGVPPPQQQYPDQPPAGYYPPPPGAAPGGAPGAYPLPPGAPPAYPPPPGPGQDVYYPPPPAPEPEPEPEGFDPMSFPPGLIPKLVEEKLRTDPPYSPLSILDIEQTGVPPLPKMDAYLKARVDKMYAQLTDYRPGMLFSDIEVDAPRSGKHFSDREREPAAAAAAPLPPSMPDLPHAGLGLGAAPGAAMGFGPGGMPVDDGSFAGLGSGRGGSGLGWSSNRSDRRQQHESAGAEAAGPAAGAADGAEQPGMGPVLGSMPPPGEGAPTFESVFSSYRNMRSKGYHTMILNNAAKKFGR
ncbi:hypothetical protein ABPG75_000799 [Micractinium tetrahymenae]